MTTMWRSVVLCVIAISAASCTPPKSGEELVSSVLDTCVQMDCVKEHVLAYLDTVSGIQAQPRSVQDVDMAIFERTARLLRSSEYKFKLPEMLFDGMEVVYSPKKGLDLVAPNQEESRGFLVKKKILFPLLLLLKLKMKALLPIFVALAHLKAVKALILSKLAIIIVIGFIIYQFVGKSGMPLPMSMQPAEPPAPMYGAPPAPSPSPPSSYEPGWEPNQGGPYARIWTPSSGASATSDSQAQNLAYSAYYPAYPAASSTTTRP